MVVIVRLQQAGGRFPHSLITPTAFEIDKSLTNNNTNPPKRAEFECGATYVRPQNRRQSADVESSSGAGVSDLWRHGFPRASFQVGQCPNRPPLTPPSPCQHQRRLFSFSHDLTLFSYLSGNLCVQLGVMKLTRAPLTWCIWRPHDRLALPRYCYPKSYSCI